VSRPKDEVDRNCICVCIRDAAIAAVLLLQIPMAVADNRGGQICLRTRIHGNQKIGLVIGFRAARNFTAKPKFTTSEIFYSTRLLNSNIQSKIR